MIRTPDQRVRVFVSSTLRELAAERTAAKSAIGHLHPTPMMFDTGVRLHPSRDLYRAYLARSEVFVAIYWQRYGWVAPGEEVSGLEDEYRLSGDKPKLIYVKGASEREPRLVDPPARIRADDGGSYKPFGPAEDLAELLAEELAVLLTERFARSLMCTWASSWTVSATRSFPRSIGLLPPMTRRPSRDCSLRCSPMGGAGGCLR